MKTYGTISRHQNRFTLDLAPQVRARVRRLFPYARHTDRRALTLPDTLDICADLEMIHGRWPLEPVGDAIDYIQQRADHGRLLFQQCQEVLIRGTGHRPCPTILPLRPYQEAAVRLLMLRRHLLVGDDLGLGKTAIALGAIAAGCAPAIIVCQNHLTSQWQAQSEKFLGSSFIVHRQLTGKDRPLPHHHILILPYSMLSKWGDRLGDYQMIVFDEAQELRKQGTQKYSSARDLARKCDRVLGLTATPVYNYGEEIWNILDLIEPDCLGPEYEFKGEWCHPLGSHWVVRDPAALGAFLAEQHIFLRRRRSEVGRELPPINRIVQDVDYDESIMDGIAGEAARLAKLILTSTDFHETGTSARLLDILLRQKTGLAKAPAVARLVADLVRGGERVVLCGWHRDVYNVWISHFQAHHIPHKLYTGTESSRQKEEAVTTFLNGLPGVLVLSLRSGAGLDGLQEKCSCIVFGELDWSPQVHDQCIGRLRRDGQAESITARTLARENPRLFPGTRTKRTSK